MGLRATGAAAGRYRTLADHVRSAAASGRLRRYQARVGRTVAVVIPEDSNDPLYWVVASYCNDYGFPVGVKESGTWQHPSGTAWPTEIGALLEAAPFVGRLGG